MRRLKLLKPYSSAVSSYVPGVTALIAAPIAHRQVTAPGWLAAWLIEAIVAATIALIMMHKKAARLGTEVLSLAGRRLFSGLLPALAAGGLLTVVLMRQGPVGLIPGVWLVLYGVAVMQASAKPQTTDLPMG